MARSSRPSQGRIEADPLRSPGSVKSAHAIDVPELEDVPGTARLYKTSERHIYELVQTRRIPFVRIGGKLRFRRADLLKFIEDNTVWPA